MAGPTLLQSLITVRNWTYPTFCKEFERTAARLGLTLTVSGATYRRWKAGQVRTLPDGDACRVLEAMFDRPADGLFAPAPTDPEPSHALEALIDMTAHDAHQQAAQSAAASVPDATVDQLRDDVGQLARGYSARPTASTFQQGKQLLDQVQALRDRTQVPDQQQHLAVLAGQACALLSQAAFDLGHLDASARLARTASVYGEAARFTPLQAFAGGTLAYCAYFTSRYSDAVNHARQAQMLPGLGDTARIRLAAIEARAYGYLQDRGAVRRALEMQEAFDGSNTDEMHDDVGGEFAFGPSRQSMSNASTLLLMRDGQAAEKASQRAMDLVLARPPRQRSAVVLAKAAVDLALARLLRGDLEGAHEALDLVWRVPADQRVTGLMNRVGTLRRALTNERFQGTHLVAELADHSEDFTRGAQLGSTATLLALEA
jgi:hypothetical protein